jgi:hypothetical protein
VPPGTFAFATVATAVSVVRDDVGMGILGFEFAEGTIHATAERRPGTS